MAEKVKLTKRNIDALARPEKTDRIRYYDAEIPGLALQVYPSGRKAFFLNYGPEKRRRRIKIGDYGSITPDQARAKAKELIGSIVGGGDPLDHREAERSAQTFGEWVDTYMTGVRRRKKHPRNDKRYLDKATERWGQRPLHSIDVTDVRKLFESISGKGRTIDANRWLASLRACLQAAWREDLISSNPAMKVKPNPENPPRDRVLTNDELKNLFTHVEGLEDPHARVGFMLLIETGARLSEVLRAKWSDMDLATGVWRLPTTKSGKPQVMPLAPGTVALLGSTPRLGEYVVAGRNPEKPRYDLKKPWGIVRSKLGEGAQDLRIHDIRRTFGLHVARSAGLHVASKLLRHSDIRVTERHYAPLGLSELRAALDRRGEEVLAIREETEEQVDE